jgi:hypothetical protein
MVHGERPNERPVLVDAVPSPPRDEPCDVVARDVCEQNILAEKFDQIAQSPLGVGGSGVVLPDLVPVPAGNIIESQRRARRSYLLDVPLRLLAFSPLYRFRVPPSRALGRAEKAITCDFEVVLEVW